MANPRARTLVPASGNDRKADDHVVLPHDGRHRRRITMRTEGDLVFLLDLAEPTRLMHGDGLLLDDGRMIGVVSAEEPVAEITARDAHHLARLAWHLGNRHLPTEVLPVKLSFLTVSLEQHSTPIAGPCVDGITLNSPLGSPSISASLASAIAYSGVSPAGLLTTAQPAASAGAIFRASIALGKFDGVIVATTPTGCLMTMMRLSSRWPGMVSP